MAKAKTRKAKPKQPTVPELAAGTNLSERQVHRYLAKGCPRDSVESVLEWKAANIRDPIITTTTAAPGTLAEARLALLQQQALKEEQLAQKHAIENEQRRGSLIERDVVERDLTICLARFRNRIERLGIDISSLMPSDAKALTKQTVDRAVQTAFKELCNDLDSIADDEDDDDDD